MTAMNSPLPAFSRRNIPLFRSRKEALDWLIED